MRRIASLIAATIIAGTTVIACAGTSNAASAYVCWAPGSGYQITTTNVDYAGYLWSTGWHCAPLRYV
jgi:hypothetical protein